MRRADLDGGRRSAVQTSSRTCGSKGQRDGGLQRVGRGAGPRSMESISCCQITWIAGQNVRDCWIRIITALLQGALLLPEYLLDKLLLETTHNDSQDLA
jgi:hypothetical protein